MTTFFRGKEAISYLDGLIGTITDSAKPENSHNYPNRYLTEFLDELAALLILQKSQLNFMESTMPGRSSLPISSSGLPEPNSLVADARPAYEDLRTAVNSNLQIITTALLGALKPLPTKPVPAALITNKAHRRLSEEDNNFVLAKSNRIPAFFRQPGNNLITHANGLTKLSKPNPYNSFGTPYQIALKYLPIDPADAPHPWQSKALIFNYQGTDHEFHSINLVPNRRSKKKDDLPESEPDEAGRLDNRIGSALFRNSDIFFQAIRAIDTSQDISANHQTLLALVTLSEGLRDSSELIHKAKSRIKIDGEETAAVVAGLNVALDLIDALPPDRSAIIRAIADDQIKALAREHNPSLSDSATQPKQTRMTKAIGAIAKKLT